MFELGSIKSLTCSQTVCEQPSKMQSKNSKIKVIKNNNIAVVAVDKNSQNKKIAVAVFVAASATAGGGRAANEHAVRELLACSFGKRSFVARLLSLTNRA